MIARIEQLDDGSYDVPLQFELRCSGRAVATIDAIANVDADDGRVILNRVIGVDPEDNITAALIALGHAGESPVRAMIECEADRLLREHNARADAESCAMTDSLWRAA